ncbi:diguanylate cyclase [[Bacillus] selenitireducens MLS10]|uniref:Diguanylate cyclase n=1 Tax=Bacillus selenitireducens (strain ATCC 700615 / DSM 15326 / MLS10) TaxID=439292 RepID=D6Y164_BACIE|nr:diguanylate cyclase [[Bacillus] selenitireducens MLS10]
MPAGTVYAANSYEQDAIRVKPIGRGTSIIFLTAAVLFAALSVFLYSNELHIELQEASPFDENWTAIIDGEAEAVNEIPGQIDTPAGEPLIIEKNLPESFTREQAVMFRSSLQYASVYLDDRLIHQSLDETASGLRLPPASHWFIVDIPADASGQTLRLELTSPYEDMSGRINHAYAGDRAGLQAQLFHDYMVDLLFALIIIGTGFAMLGSYVFLRSIRPYEMLYLGMMVLTSGFWFLAESRMIQFFTGNQFLIGGLAYVALAFIPIPLLMYVKHVILTDERKWLNAVTAFLFSWFVFIIVLQLSGIADFFETLTVTFLLSFISYTLVIGLMIFESLKYRNQDAKRFLAGIGLLLFFALIEVLSFLLYDPVFTSDILRIGFGLFLLLMAANALTSLIKRLKTLQESAIYEQLAYTDPLTQGYNRMAFERDVQSLLSDSESANGHWLLYVDINDMKAINDEYGHKSGDEAIRIIFRLMTDIIGNKGHGYRIGGDEFAAILAIPSEEEIERLIESLISAVKEADKELPYHLSAAVGRAYVHLGETTNLSDLLHEADKNMYAEKLKTKGQKL